jgi:hypothetical protein
MKHITIGIVLLHCRASLCGSKNGSMSQIGSLALLIALAVYSFLAGDPGSGPGAARFGTIR